MFIAAVFSIAFGAWLIRREILLRREVERRLWS